MLPKINLQGYKLVIAVIDF